MFPCFSICQGGLGNILVGILNFCCFQGNINTNSLYKRKNTDCKKQKQMQFLLLFRKFLVSGIVHASFNPYKPSVPFVGHKQTVQT